MRNLFLFLTLAILCNFSPSMAKAEDGDIVFSNPKYKEDISTKNRVVDPSGFDYTINGFVVPCLWISQSYPVQAGGFYCFESLKTPVNPEPTPEPEDEPTICNGCPDINISTPMKTFKNNRIKIIK